MNRDLTLMWIACMLREMISRVFLVYDFRNTLPRSLDIHLRHSIFMRKMSQQVQPVHRCMRAPPTAQAPPMQAS
jgi:hypothetical protein